MVFLHHSISMSSGLHLLFALHLCGLATGVPGGCFSRCSGGGHDSDFNDIPPALPRPVRNRHQELSPFHDHAAGMHDNPNTNLITIVPTMNDSGDRAIEHHAPSLVIHEWPEYMDPVNLRNERTYRLADYTPPFEYLMWMYQQDHRLGAQSNRFIVRRTPFRMNSIQEVGHVVLHYNPYARQIFVLDFDINPINLQRDYVRIMGRFLRKVEFLGTIWMMAPTAAAADGASTSETSETLILSTAVRSSDGHDEAMLNSAWSWSMDYSGNGPPQTTNRYFKNRFRAGLQVAMSGRKVLYQVVGYWTDVDLIEGPDGAGSSSAALPPANGHGSSGYPTHDPSGKGKGKIP